MGRHAIAEALSAGRVEENEVPQQRPRRSFMQTAQDHSSGQMMSVDVRQEG